MIRSHTPLLALLLFASASTVASAAGRKTPAPSINMAIRNAQPTASAQAAVAAPRAAAAQPAAAAAPLLTLEPAPIPNEELFAPVQRANEDPQINPTVFRPSAQFRGDGILPGSSAQSYEERHMMPAVGANLNVPLR